MAKKNSCLEHAVKKDQRPLYACLGILAVVVVGAVCYGVFSLLSYLSAICAEQARITDQSTQVSIAAGKLIGARLVINHFGLTNGANTAEMPYDELRARFLKDMANVRDVRITRKSPNFVHVDVFERTPVARVAGAKSQGVTTSCVDSEGVVFYYPTQKTALLPLIRVPDVKPPKYGTKLSGLAMAALHLAEEASAEAFGQMKIQDVDASGKDFLVTTLDNAARVKLAWADMGEDSAAARESLRRQLTRLNSAINSKVAEGAKLWNATDYGTPGRVYATDPLAAEN